MSKLLGMILLSIVLIPYCEAKILYTTPDYYTVHVEKVEFHQTHGSYILLSHTPFSVNLANYEKQPFFLTTYTGEKTLPPGKYDAMRVTLSRTFEMRGQANTGLGFTCSTSHRGPSLKHLTLPVLGGRVRAGSAAVINLKEPSIQAVTLPITPNFKLPNNIKILKNNLIAITIKLPVFTLPRIMRPPELNFSFKLKDSLKLVTADIPGIGSDCILIPKQPVICVHLSKQSVCN